MGTWNVLLRAKQKLLAGAVDLSGTVIRAGLWRGTANLSNTVDVSTVASITNQLPSARGYGQAGVSVSNFRITLSATTAWALHGDGYCWSANGGSLGSGAGGTTSIQFGVIWQSGAAKSGIPLAYATLSTAQFSVPSGSALQINGGQAGADKIYFTLT